MNRPTSAAAFAILCLFSVRLDAQSVGDTVVVIRPTDVKVENKVLYRHHPGIHFVVGAVQGKWLWINHKISGWISRDDVIELDQAPAYFTQLLERDPTNTDMHLARGNVWSALKKWEQAIDDYDQAVNLDPNSVAAYGNRAIAWRNLGDYDKAIADYNAAIKLAPDHAMLHRNRGIAWRHQKEYRKALADFNEAIRLQPDQAGGYNSRAWLFATCSDPAIASPAQAVEDARRACELSSWKSADFLETFATACAAQGNFEEAVKWQSRAHELAPESQRAEAARLLDLYSQGKPYQAAESNKLAVKE